MQNLEKVIGNYLSRPTSYAAMITGNWGVGKTQYYKDKLEPLIAKKTILGNDMKFYKPVYLSLFGLRSIDEIAAKIQGELFFSKVFKAYWTKRWFRKTLRVSTSMARIAIRAGKVNNLNDHLADIREIGKDVLDTQELVICFDDMERKSSTLPLHDLIGYINSLVNGGVKVIVIANENRLENENEEYIKFKEKIIGLTIPFILCINSTLTEIIDKHYGGYAVYREFLTQHMELVTQLSNGVGHNFRHVIYALDCLHHVHSELKCNILDVQNEINPFLEPQLSNIAMFTLMLAAEYKATSFQYKEMYQYDSIPTRIQLIQRSTAALNTSKKVEKTAVELMLDRYRVAGKDYRFYSSIFSHITGVREFVASEFIIEFKKRFNLEKGITLPQYQLLNKLSSEQCLDLDRQQYREGVLAILDHAYAGDYQPRDYITVMEVAEQMGNPLQLPLTEIIDKLVTGMENILLQQGEDVKDDFVYFDTSARHISNSENIRVLHSKVMDIFRSWKANRLRSYQVSLARQMENDPKAFIEKYRKEVSFSSMVQTSRFARELDAQLLIERLREAGAKTTFLVSQFWADRYSDPMLATDEASFIQNFAGLVNKWYGEITEPWPLNYMVGQLNDLLSDLFSKVAGSIGTTSSFVLSTEESLLAHNLEPISSTENTNNE